MFTFPLVDRNEADHVQIRPAGRAGLFEEFATVGGSRKLVAVERAIVHAETYVFLVPCAQLWSAVSTQIFLQTRTLLYFRRALAAGRRSAH